VFDCSIAEEWSLIVAGALGFVLEFDCSIAEKWSLIVAGALGFGLLV